MSLPTSLPTPGVCLQRTVVCVAQHSMAEMRTASVNPPRNRGRQQRFPRLRKTSPPSAAASRRVRPHLVRGPITFCFSSLPVYKIGPAAEAVVELAEEKRKRACWCATRRRCACRGRRGGTLVMVTSRCRSTEAISTNLILGLTLQNQVWQMSDGLSLRRNTPGATLRRAGNSMRKGRASLAPGVRCRSWPHKRSRRQQAIQSKQGTRAS